ncbi:MAG: HigA family addiction module antidote protein [Treponema sp.]|jgi:addiction module HigA family antidote|nr:HigA family addiction module antidote protein [Treponema sp.]
MKKIEPILPGEILEEEFLKPFGITAYKLAKEINISATRISEIIRGKRRITIDTALRLSKYFGNSVEFWIGIQNEYEIRQEKEILENQLKEIHTFEKVLA